jgi:hypothetical protein
MRAGSRRASRAVRTAVLIAIAAALAAACNSILGIKDPTLEQPSGGTDAAIDAPIDAAIDAAIDGPPPTIWVFVTDAGVDGSFGSNGHPRQVADAKCEDKYNFSFTARGCTAGNIHAVIQIDDNLDTLDRMKTTFVIPATSPLLRATDAMMVTDRWDTFVNPNAALVAPVSMDTSAVPRFWSGRSTISNLNCAGWTNGTSAVSGNIGDVTKMNAWMSQGNSTCDHFEVRLVCACW